MKTAPLLLVFMLAGSARAQTTPDIARAFGDAENAIKSKGSEGAVAGTPAATPVARGASDVDLFAKEFSIVSCQTDWKKGGWSDYSDSFTRQILPDQFSAADAKNADGRSILPLAAKIIIERKGAALLIHGIDAEGRQLGYGREQLFEMGVDAEGRRLGYGTAQSYEVSFVGIDEPVSKTGQSNLADPNMQITCPEPGTEAYPTCIVTKYPNLNRDFEHDSLKTKLTRTKSGGWALTQSQSYSEGSKSAVTLWMHSSVDEGDSFDNRLELSADGALTYHVHERGKHKTAKWDVTQDCAFKPDLE